jgi:phosphatidylinositol 4-kinase
MNQNERGGTNNFMLQLRQHRPFRALLHLYAHEDVFVNKKLDRAFSMENRSAISFYAPQLLCFLLHNAYLSTGKLERWILEQCKTNTYFAHQCFWFLRAWCLQGGIYRPDVDLLDDEIGIRNNTNTHDMPLSGISTHSEYSASGLSAHSFSDIKGGLVKRPSEHDLRKTSGIKLSSEERVAVENLLSKIIECGEISTRIVQSNEYSDEGAELHATEDEPKESSPLHYGDVVNGGIGLNDLGYLASPSDNQGLGLMPKTLSSVRLNESGQEIQSYFLRTPDFLDRLMGIADDLIYIPKADRTEQLQKQLIALEGEMLPSNSIYVPVNGSTHHVCRIVSSECIAISTKERVPCIIYLEVIDHINKSDDAYDSNNETIQTWRKSPRQPQRHNTIFTKVSKSLKKLRLDLEENHDKIFGENISREEILPLHVASEHNPHSTSKLVFKEDWDSKIERIRANSPFSNHPNWRLLPILIKTNDDIRQEQLAAQLINCMATILARARIPVWLNPYDILALSFRGGIIEAIPDTMSIDSLRKKLPDLDMKQFFEVQFGEIGSDPYENAKANFVESLAAYSIVCFLLQIKDRHNGNIMLDNKGHLVHIDFGFFFLSSPGKNSGFESAPFKLTRDFVDLMDGANSNSFMKFRELCCRTFLELRKNCFQITLLVQMLIEGNEDLDCFRNRPHEAVKDMQDRFRLDLNDKACVEFVNSLIDSSLENWTTSCYDRYQRCFVGIM